MNESETDERLLELGKKTEALRPPDGFSARVMRAVELEPRPRSSRRVRSVSLVVFALAAASAIFVSTRAESLMDEYALTTFESVEIEQ
jgi:hypothetical protein